MKVLIDISNIIPGKGGSGGGVAVYANNLLEELDQLIEASPTSIICIKNVNNVTRPFKNIRVLETSYNTSNLLSRLIWLNFYLPFYCLKHRVAVLHRVVPELPLIKVCKYICTLHDLMYRFHLKKIANSKLSFMHKLKSTLYGMILRRSIASADYILVPSNFIRSEVIAVFGLNPAKIEATHLGVSKISVDQNDVKRSENDRFKFVVVAGFYPHKGHARVIELSKALIKKGYKNFSVTFRGNPFDDNIVESLKQKIKNYNLEEYIFFDDFKKSHDLKSIYSSYDALLLLSEYEGFGLPVLEAQMFGLPVVCSDIEIFKEVLDDSAIFIDTENIDVSTDAILDLVQDDAVQSSLVKKGFKNQERFSWKKMSATTISSYNRFLN